MGKGKSIAVASKFTEEENEKIEVYAELHGVSKSQVVHDLVIKGMTQKPQNDKGVKSVGFLFKENYAYFWKGTTYRGTLMGDEVSIRFGGEWKNYKLSELPVEVVE